MPCSLQAEHHQLRCEIRRREQKKRKVILEVVVTCEGKRIPEDLMDKVFLPFEMVSQLEERSSFHGGLVLRPVESMGSSLCSPR